MLVLVLVVRIPELQYAVKVEVEWEKLTPRKQIEALPTSVYIHINLYGIQEPRTEQYTVGKALITAFQRYIVELSGLTC